MAEVLFREYLFLQSWMPSYRILDQVGKGGGGFIGVQRIVICKKLNRSKFNI